MSDEPVDDPAVTWQQVAEMLEPGVALPASACQTLAAYFRQNDAADYAADGADRALPVLIECLTTTATTLSDIARDRQGATGGDVEPEGEVEDWMWDIGHVLNDVSFGISKLHPTGSAEPELRGFAEQLTQIGALLPWRAYAPHALLAHRALALIESKANRYAAAWHSHHAARRLRERYLSETHLPQRVYDALDQSEQLLWLSEVGTGCRGLEYYVAEQAAEHLDAPAADRAALFRGLQEIEVTLTKAQHTIDRIAAYDTPSTDGRGPGLPNMPTRDHLVAKVSYRQPGIMGARAALLKIIVAEAMLQGRIAPAAGAPSWAQQQSAAWALFETFYRIAEDPSDLLPAERAAERVPARIEYLRSLVQLRLAAALMSPGLRFPSRRDRPASLIGDTLDGDAVQRLSKELLEWKDHGRPKPADANAIGTSISVRFNDAVISLRESAEPGSGADYLAWRSQYPKLDQRWRDPGRTGLVEAALSRSSRSLN